MYTKGEDLDRYNDIGIRIFENSSVCMLNELTGNSNLIESNNTYMYTKLIKSAELILYLTADGDDPHR